MEYSVTTENDGVVMHHGYFSFIGAVANAMELADRGLDYVNVNKLGKGTILKCVTGVHWTTKTEEGHWNIAYMPSLEEVRNLRGWEECLCSK